MGLHSKRHITANNLLPVFEHDTFQKSKPPQQRKMEGTIRIKTNPSDRAPIEQKSKTRAKKEACLDNDRFPGLASPVLFTSPHPSHVAVLLYDFTTRTTRRGKSLICRRKFILSMMKLCHILTICTR